MAIPAFIFSLLFSTTLFAPHIKKIEDLLPCSYFRIFDWCEELKLICYEKVYVLCIHCGLFTKHFARFHLCLCILSHFLIIMLKSKSAHPAFLNDKLATVKLCFLYTMIHFPFLGIIKTLGSYTQAWGKGVVFVIHFPKK